jgi:hypothetical protein
MSDDLTASIIRELRQQTVQAPEEEMVELEGQPFDPIMKIASCLARSKTAKFEVGQSRRRAMMWDDHDATVEGDLPELYDASTICLLEYLCSETKSMSSATSPFLGVVLAASAGNINDAIKRISLIRIHQTYLINHKHEEEFVHRDDKEKYKEKRHAFAQKPIDELARGIALGIYTKSLVHLYYQHWGLPESGTIKTPKTFKKERTEPYEKPGQCLVPLDPRAVIAANVFYPSIEGFEAPLRKAKSAFDLVLLTGIKTYQEFVDDQVIECNIDRLLQGRIDIPTMFYHTVLQYTLALGEEKLR